MPQHKRGPWSQNEDQFLLHLVNQFGAHNWVRISATIQTRSPKQCRERYHQNLKPNLNHDPITPEEGVLIEQMVSEMGKRWAEIARRLRGRSDNAVKNWWNGGMNRRRRSNAPRREADMRQQPSMSTPSLAHPPTHHHTLPSNYAQHGQQYYGQTTYQHAHHVPGPSSMSSYRNSGHSSYVETPLPSPSAFSSLSADGTPSLLSDTSSVSGRSPHHGPSGMELPPLAGPAGDRRYSAASGASGLRLSVPNSFTEVDFSQPPLPHKSHMLQEAFQPRQQPQPQQPQFQPHPPQPQQTPPQHAFPQPAHYLPSQPAEPIPHPQQYQQYTVPSQSGLRGEYPPQPIHHAAMGMAPMHSLQLPSIANLAVSESRAHATGLSVDPALGSQQGHALPSAPTPDGSPRDKMRLSNLTT